MDETAPAGATAGVGALLRDTRERRGQDLGFVANALRIRQPYLQAIEDGRPEDLPGSTYAVGFVRGYAEYLGLDSKEIVRRFRQENGEFANRAELVFPSAVSEGSIPTGALLGFALLAAAAAYGAWYWYQSREPSVASAVPALPERLAALIHQPVGNGSELVPVDGSSKVNEVPQPPAAAPPAAEPAFPTVPSPSGAGSVPPVNPAHEDVVPPSEDDGAAAAPSPSAPPVVATDVPSAGDGKSVDAKPQDGKPGRDAKGKTVVRSSDSARPVAEPPADAAVTPNTPLPGDGQPAEAATDGKLALAKPAAVASSSRVVLMAKEDCWIEIRDVGGKVVQKRLLKKGDSYAAPTRPGLTMTVGNAGALSLVVDGKATGSLGRMGMVRRGVPLDAERLRDGVEPPAEPLAEPPADPLAEPSVPATSRGGGTSGTE